MKEISAEKKNNIVNLLEKGIPARQIARQLQIHEKTVRRIRDGACPAKISKGTIRRIQRSVTSGKANIATEMARQLRNDAIANFHPITVRSALRRVGLIAWKKVKKSRLQDRHRTQRLELRKITRVGPLKTGVARYGVTKRRPFFWSPMGASGCGRNKMQGN